MKRKIAGFILRSLGWKVENNIPESITKCVVMMAPHTSYWDFIYGWLGFAMLGISSKFLIKKEAFFFPLGAVLRKLGGIPVDRQAKNNVVMQVGEMYRKSSELFVTIAPEGTRSLNHTWKKGFYYIAEYGKVPIGLGYLDYKMKLGGLGKIIYPTGDYARDLKEIEDFYRGMHGRYPEKFNLYP